MNEQAAPAPFTAAYWENRATKLLGQVEAMAEENDRLRDLLATYGHHVESCPAFDPPPGLPGFTCECGWAEIEAEFTRSGSQAGA